MAEFGYRPYAAKSMTETPQPVESRRPKLVVVALVLASAIAAAGTISPAFDYDLWWHLRVGKSIVESAELPTTDSFSRLGREQPTTWIAYSWLFEVGLYEVYSLFGDNGVYWTRTLLGIFSTGTVLVSLLGHIRGKAIELIVIVLTGATLAPLMNERPWHFTIAFAALTVATMDDLRNGRSVRHGLWLVPLFAFWANVHIQFVLGWLVLGLGVVFPGRADRWKMAGLATACTLATAINPYHFRLVVVIWEYATQAGPLQSVNELQPPDPWHWQTWTGVVVVAVAAISVARRRPVDWFRAGLLLFGLVLPFRMRRDLWFSGVAAAGAIRDGSVHGLGTWRTLGLVAVVFIFTRVASFAGIGPTANPIEANTKRFPVAAVAFVRSEELQGPLFNTFDWGGYLIWTLPDHPVSIDGRTNLFGSERVIRACRHKASMDACNGDPDLTSANLAIVPADWQVAQYLRERSDWQIVYEDEIALVLTRKK